MEFVSQVVRGKALQSWFIGQHLAAQTWRSLCIWVPPILRDTLPVQYAVCR
jgi:hypothetical protein